MPTNSRVLTAEAFGTAVLMLGGPGTAILMKNSEAKVLAVALGFGFSLLIMAYVIGPISGCHINPAVSLGLYLARKVSAAHALFAVLGQIVGAAAGGFIVWMIARNVKGFERGSFASNGYRAHSIGGYGLKAAIIVEVVFTALLVIVVLFTTTKKFSVGMGGLTVGLTLALIHLITIQVDQTSVNPARSFGTAIFADSSSDAMNQLWVFLIFPLIGAAVGVVIWLALDDSRQLEDTMLDSGPTRAVRDAASTALDTAVSIVDGIEPL